MNDPVSDGAPPVVAAVVDVGFTSVHALVARVLDDRLDVLLDTSAFLGLGPVVERSGLLGTAAADELCETLADVADRAGALGAGAPLVLGAEPLRRASDAARVVHAVQRTTGLALHVLTQREEASLTLIGATGGRRASEPITVVDVGGGSTELVRAVSGTGVTVVGLPLGAARLTGRFASHDPPTRAEVAALVDAARSVVAGSPGSRPRNVVAVGGTAENLLRVVPGASLEGRLTKAGLEAALTALSAEPADAFAARHGLRPIRAGLLPAGAAILLALLDAWEADEVRVSAAGLREGAILALVAAGTAWRDRLPQLAAGWRA